MNVLDVGLAIFAVLVFPFALVSTVILWKVGRTGPRVGALAERSFIAADICVMLGSGALLTLNRLTDHAFFPVEVAAPVFSVSLIILGAIPVNWVRLWYSGKLGRDGIAIAAALRVALTPHVGAPAADAIVADPAFRAALGLGK